MQRMSSFFGTRCLALARMQVTSHLSISQVCRRKLHSAVSQNIKHQVVPRGRSTHAHPWHPHNRPSYASCHPKAHGCLQSHQFSSISGQSQKRSRLLMLSVAALAVFGGGLFWVRKKTSQLSMFARGSILRAEKAIQEGDVKEAERQLVAAAEDTERRFGQKSLNMLFVVEKLARFYHEIGRFSDAETNYKRGLQVLLSLGYPQTNVGVVTTSLSLADVYLDRGDLEKASVGYEWCLERAREAAKLGSAEDEGDLVDLCLDRQAKLLARMGKAQQAVDAYRPVLERAQQQVKQSSGDQRAQSEAKYAHMLNTMAVLCDGAHKYEEGLSFAKVAIAMCDGGRHAELLSSALYNQGCLQFHLGNDLEAAEQSLLAARAAAEAVGDGHQMAAVDRVMGNLRAKLGRAKSA